MEKRVRTRSTKYSKTKGNSYETRIAKELRDLGFTGCVTSRSESKRFDARKVDIIDTEGKLPIWLQLKCTQNIPSYFKIKEESGLIDKPFCIIWNAQEKKEVNICSKGEVVIIPKDFFYELLKQYV